MKVQTVKNKEICRENNAEFYDKWFSQRKDKQFITHVDTLYFLVTPAIEKYSDSIEWGSFIGELSEKKEKAETIRENIPIFEDVLDGLEVVGYRGAQMYSLHFGLEDNFDVFVCANVPNSNTPSVMVQIRSQSLWLNGLKNSFNKAYYCIEKVLKKFGIIIKSVQENRIDYAFHTNYINDFMNFFPEKDLGKMLVGNFRRGRKDFNLHNHDENEYGDRIVESDYMTIGRHKSNNFFFRAYNKTKEVIEQGYKQFFIQIWKRYGMINDFDVYVLERAFKYGTYESKDKARCEFYYDYGKNDEIRREIYEKLKNPDTPAKWYTKRAKDLVPDVTIITNVELQTKRKFYDRLGKNMPFITKEESPKKNIYNIFEQMSELIRFMTEDTIRFVNYKGKHAKIHREKRPMADWWVRLRNAKKVEINDEWIIDYIREYQHNLDIERQKSLTINKISSIGAYFNVIKEFMRPPKLIEQETGTDEKSLYANVAKDITTFYENLNDNDVMKYYRRKNKKIKEILRKFE